MPDGSWHHIVAEYGGDGGNRKLWIDGVQDFDVTSDFEIFSYATDEGPLMNGQPGETLELRVLNMSEPSKLATSFWLSMPGSSVTVPDF